MKSSLHLLFRWIHQLICLLTGHASTRPSLPLELPLVQWHYLLSLRLMVRYRAYLAFVILAAWLGGSGKTWAQAQLTLPPASPYTQGFNGIGTALPSGWTGRIGATSTSVGTVTANTGDALTQRTWSSNNAGFNDYASNESLPSTANAGIQNGATDRAFGVRQTGAFGDPGAAFVLRIDNTSGKTNFALRFKLQSLDGTAPRSTTLVVDYGVGASPTTFIPVTTSPATLTIGGNQFANTTVLATLPVGFSNRSQQVYLRIVALAPTSGSNSRGIAAIDDFRLTYDDCTAPTAFNVTGGGAYCGSGPGVAIGLSGSETGVNYQLFNGTDAVGSPVTGTGNALAFTPQTTAGTYRVLATSASTNCTAIQSGNAVVTVNAPPTVANAGASQTITAGSSATLAANTPTTGTGSWSVTSGPSTLSTQFSSTTDPMATFTPAGGSGDYVLTWTISNAPCPPSSSNVTITVAAPSCPQSVTNVTTGATFCTIQAAIDAPATLNGHTVQVGGGPYNEQVLINKSVTIIGVGSPKPVINFTGTPALASGRLTLFEVTAPNVTIENLQFTPDLAKIGSAILASVSLPGSVSALTVRNNDINPYQTGTLVAFSQRNAVNINYGTAVRVNSSNPANLLLTGNTITYNDGGTASTPGSVNSADDAGFRAGFAVDEGGGTFTGNTIQTVSQDIEARFGSAGAISITNNTINGGGINLAEYNAGACAITVLGNTFNGAFGSAYTSALRLKNNTPAIPTTVSGNTFTGHNWGISLENYQAVTVDNNTFTPATASTSYRHVTVNTKEFSSSSGGVTPAVSLTLIRNTFTGSSSPTSGTALIFANQDNDNPTFGSFTLGTAGNENNFAASLGTFIALDNSTGPIAPNGTTAVPFAIDLNAVNNKFDVGSGLKLPQAMTAAERAALETKLFHKPDVAALGLITYFSPVRNVTQNTLFNAIQPAIDAANPNDVIELAENTFNERATVTKPLTLTGVSQTGTIIDGTGLSAGNGLTLQDNVSGISIGNLTIRKQTGSANATGNGIRGQTNNNLIITNVSSVSNAVHGIALETSGTLSNVSVTNSTLSNNGVGTSGRGFIIFNNLKQNITVSGNLVQNNGLTGVDINEGTATGTTITSNTLTANGDAGISLLGALATGGANLVANNIVTDNGRFGMEIKSSIGTGAASGMGSLVIENNIVTRTTPFSPPTATRDLAGIAVIRRAATVSVSTVETPQGAVVRNNVVSGFVNNDAGGEGFGIVVEGTNYQVTGNNVTNNEIGIQEQKTTVGERGRTAGAPTDGDSPQGDATPFFDRGNSIVACGVVTGNNVSGNTTANTRQVGTVSGQSGIVRNTSTGAVFCTIQSAVDAATAGNSLSVSAGTFTENVTINKSLTINGANAGINPNTGTRGAETIIVPATSGANDAALLASSLVNVFTLTGNAPNVVIDGFTVDGDNPARTDQTNSVDINGADIDAAAGISGSSSTIGGLTVRNNVLKNFTFDGIDLDATAAPSSNTIQNNKFDNIAYLSEESGSGQAVVILNDAFANITNNVMTRVLVGVQTNNHYQAAPGGTPSISSNTISAYDVGIFHNLQYANATGFTISDNTISADAGLSATLGGPPFAGLLIYSIQGTVPATFGNNTINSGFDYGVDAWNTPSPSVTINGGSVRGTVAGVRARNRSGFGDGAALVTLTGTSITNSPVGVLAFDNPAAAAGISASVIVTGNTQISGTGAFTAIAVSGPDASASIVNNASSFTGNGSGVGMDVNGGTAGVTTSRITNFATGILVSNGGRLTGVTNSSVASNTDNGIVYTADANTTQGAITTNFLAGNTNKAIVNGLTSTTINANCNWFGPPSTTANPTYVTGNVTATQQLANGTDEDGEAPGFQNTSCFTPVVAVAPTLTATAPANNQEGSPNASYCVGENPTVTSNCTTGVNSFTVQALSDGSTTVTTGSSVQITQGAGTYFVYATCTQNGTTSPVSATTTIRVQPNVSSFTSNKATYCVGEAVSLTALGCNVAASPQSQLYFVRLRALDGSGNANQGTVNLPYGQTTYTFTPSFAPTVPTSYTFTAECVNGGTGNVCVLKDLTITVTPAPTATLSASGTLTCAQTSVTLTAGGGQTYAFAGPGVVSQDPTSGTAVVNVAGTYSVTVTSAGGCTSTATTTVETNNTLAAPDFFTQSGQSYPGGVQSVTVGQNTGTVTFQFSNCIGGTVNWTGQDGSSGTGNIVALTTQPGTLTYTGTCTLNSCVSPASSVTVTTTAANTPPVATANANQTATVGVPFSYTVNAFTDAETPNSLSYTASINPANGFNFDPATRIISGTPSVSGVSSVTVTATDPGSLSASTSFTITVNPAPVVVTPLALTLTASPTMLLMTGTTTLSATVSGGTTPYSYVFSGPGTITQTSTSNTASVSGLSAGVQTFTVLVTDATSPTSQTISGTVSVTVSAANTPPVATANANQTATVGVPFSYTVAAFTDSETPNGLTYSASIDPANGFVFDPATRIITGTPSMSGVSSVTVTATDPGSLSASTSFTITVNPASMTSTAPFAITGVTTLDCTPVANRINVNFNPRYAGLNGQPISFSVVNELSPTTAPGPYTLQLYPDNPTIILKAVQSGTAGEASFSYNWLAACNSLSMVTPNNTAPTTTGIANQNATVNQGFSLNVASSFSDAETPNGLSYSATGLPAGLSLSGSTISGTPSMSGVSTVTVTATDPGSLSVSTSFTLTVSPAASTPPTGTFSITSVTTIDCTPVANRIAINFNPQYAGVNGQPISFSVVNELSPTTAPGPYSLTLYPDNPTIILKATQSGTAGEASFTYNWLAACNSLSMVTPNNTAPTTTGIANQSGTVNQGFSLNVASSFSDAETPNGLSYSATGLPAGLSLSGSTISGTPSMSGVSNVTVTATDPGSLSASTSFTFTVSPSSTTVSPPPTSPFSITGVTTVSCTVISPGQREVSFTPQYAGTTGQPISFSVVNELSPTTAPGPYTLRLYTDNPTITLKATQSGTAGEASFSYNWLAACTNGSGARLGAEPVAGLEVRVLGNPVQNGQVRVEVRGAAGQPLHLQLTDLRGQPIGSHTVKQAGSLEQHTFDIGRQAGGVLLLRASTPAQSQTVKVLTID